MKIIQLNKVNTMKEVGEGDNDNTLHFHSFSQYICFWIHIKHFQFSFVVNDDNVHTIDKETFQKQNKVQLISMILFDGTVNTLKKFFVNFNRYSQNCWFHSHYYSFDVLI
jgi:hypothetical protein